MRHLLLSLAFSLATLFACLPVGLAQDQVLKIPLWEGPAPHALGEAEKDIPSVQVYRVESETPAPTVVVCPGGGYGGLAMGHEGDQIAAWLNENGLAAVVLSYRHRGRGYQHPVPMLDVQRAIRLTRSRAADWGIDPKRIGIMGFSAGGHLASTASTHFDAGDPEAEDSVDRESCRPDFSILCYGVLTMGTDVTHKGSQRNLLGDEAPEDLVQSLSNDKMVTADTPPTFLFHTDQDQVVLPENSVLYYLALRKQKVPAEMHIFERGRHGVGLGASIPGTSEWSKLCIRWMQGRELLAK